MEGSDAGATTLVRPLDHGRIAAFCGWAGAAAGAGGGLRLGGGGDRREDRGRLSQGDRAGHRAGARARPPGSRRQGSAVIPGLELQVYREGQEFKHPYTGQILGKLDRDVGRVRILEVQPNFSVAEVIQQTEGTMVQQGDKVRVTSARVIVALPNVDVSDVAGANTRSVTRDLTNALIKTNRFEVMTDQRIRAALTEEKMATPDQFTDPAVLQALWKRLRVTAVLLAKLSLMEKAVRWDVQVLSTVRGDTITLASAEVKGATAEGGVAVGRARGGGNFAGRRTRPGSTRSPSALRSFPTRGRPWRWASSPGTAR